MTENKRSEVNNDQLERMREINECRVQINDLVQKANLLSQQIDRLMEAEMADYERQLSLKNNNNDAELSEVNVEQRRREFVPPIDTDFLKTAGSNKPAQLNRATRDVKTKHVTTHKQPANGEKHSDDLENKVGKNMFAILASLLVLIGVSIFISTFYEFIPEVVKIGIIYAFGFALLGAVTATLGLITPSVIVIMIIASFLKAFRDA